MTSKIRVVVAEDSDDVRDAVRMLIDAENDLTCVGDTDRFDGVAELCESSKAEVLVLDVGLQGQSGLHLLPVLRSRLPNLRVVMFSGYANPELVRAAATEGAAYVLKSGDVAELFETIRRSSDSSALRASRPQA